MESTNGKQARAYFISPYAYSVSGASRMTLALPHARKVPRDKLPASMLSFRPVLLSDHPTHQLPEVPHPTFVLQVELEASL